MRSISRIISRPTWLDDIKRSHALLLEGNVPRLAGISRVDLSPIWWQVQQPLKYKRKSACVCSTVGGATGPVPCVNFTGSGAPGSGGGGGTVIGKSLLRGIASSEAQ